MFFPLYCRRCCLLIISIVLWISASYQGSANIQSSTAPPPRIAVIATQSSESSLTRDIASFLNLDLQWYLSVNELANFNVEQFAGLLANIPSGDDAEQILSILENATHETDIPIIVFANSVRHATRLGLNSIVYDQERAGKRMAKELDKRHASRTLFVRSNQDDPDDSYERLAGLLQSLGDKLHIEIIREEGDDGSDSAKTLDKLLGSTGALPYDSIVALGSYSADIVARGFMTGIRTYQSLLAGFFDIESNDVKKFLLHSTQNAFAISSIPELSSLLALRTMYLQVTENFHPSSQHIIYLDPVIVNGNTLSQWDGSTCYPHLGPNQEIALVTPCDSHENGSFEQNVISGAKDLAHRLQWNVVTRCHFERPKKFESEIHSLAKNQTRGIIALSQGAHLQPEHVHFTSNGVPLVTIKFPERTEPTDSHTAKQITSDSRKIPICIYKEHDEDSRDLCMDICSTYSEVVRNDAPAVEEFIHAIQVSSISSLYRDISEILESFEEYSRIPDTVIMTFEPLYNYLQKHASIYTFDILYASNTCKSERQNGYAAGYLAVLDIFLSKHFVVKPRSLSNTLVSNVTSYTRPNETTVMSHLALEDESELNLYRSPNSWYSTFFFLIRPYLYHTVLPWSKSPTLFRSVQVILAGVLTTLLCRFIWRRAKIAAAKREVPWLLSYNELVKSPSWRYISGDSSPSMSSTSSMPLLSPSLGVLLGENEQHLTTSTLHPSGADTSTLSLSNSDKRFSAIEYINTSSRRSSSVSSQRSAASAPTDYFSIARPGLTSCMYIPKDIQGEYELERFIGIHRNLPVYVKQIGFKAIKVTEKIQKEVSLMKNARHSKLVEFIGLCIERRGAYIVEEYCSKGSLADVLSNPDINLTWLFRFSFIHDLLQGLDFLHRSKFRTHGLLSSHSCMVTGRWELKITDFGLPSIREAQYKTELHKANDALLTVYPKEKLLWLAPESIVEKVTLPESTYYIHPSRSADIYSVGIIMNEIVSRQKPYQRLLEQENLDVEAVYHGVRKKGWRPDMHHNSDDEFVEKLTSLISVCLDGDPNCRPELTAIKSRVRAIDPSAAGYENVVDNLATLLERYASDMEELVRRRTANLQQRTLELEEERARTQKLLMDLERAKNEAEAAASSKQEFLANMSHEIRTPMNAVIGMSRILMESNLPPDLHDCAETIESSGNHLMTIIDDILDFSKIESGKLRLEHQKLDLIYTIESAFKLVSTNFLDKQLVLWYDVDPEVPTSVVGDVVRIRQVLLNLLSNALKFTQHGHVHIHLEKIGPAISAPTSPLGELDMFNENRNMQALQFTVQDTGTGIPKNKLDLLFQTFYQVDALTTRNYGGTGLGLAISQKLCRMMGGDMWVESEYGKGSIFYFRIVLELQPDSPTFGTSNHLKELSATCKHIMVICDNRSAQLAWQHILSTARLSDILTMTFSEAQEHLKNGYQPSILIIDEDSEVITDIADNSDECSSRTVTSHVIWKALCKQLPAISTVPVLHVRDVRMQRREPSPILSNSSRIIQDPSASPTEEHSSEEINAAYIAKPIKISKLYALLRKLTADAESRRIAPFSADMRNVLRQQSDSSSSTTSQMSVRRASSLSSSSSDRPFAEVAGGARSLLVDDNAVNQKVVERMLKKLGVQPQIANNGKEACDMIQEAQASNKPFDLVFMDIWMPEMSGLEASKFIRQQITHSSTHPYIIAMTACAMPGDRDKCIAAGMNSYVSKPVRKEDLEAALHTYGQVSLGEMISEKSSSSPCPSSPSFSSENVASDEEETRIRNIPKVVVSSKHLPSEESSK